MPRLFDAYIMVDWSAASVPVTGKDSIWIGAAFEDAEGTPHIRTLNPPTRTHARRVLCDLLDMFRPRQRPTLLGFDFALGYPAGTAAALGIDGPGQPAWRSMFDMLSKTVEDDAHNRNCRFDVAARLNQKISSGPYPFWGAPQADADRPFLPKKKSHRVQPDAALPERRITEDWVRTNFPASPKSVWQLAYAGAVGSQVLLGIPTVAWLLDTVDACRIWPFQTGLRPPLDAPDRPTSCVIAEIYPSTVDAPPVAGEVKDEAQVRTLAQHLQAVDKSGQLSTGFSAPNSISDREIHKIEQEEGWILAI